MSLIGAVVAGIGIAAVTAGVFPVKVTGPWEIEVGPGEVTIGGQTVNVPASVRLQIHPVQKVQVRDEACAQLPVFNPKAGGWQKGVRLHALITQECSATGLLDPASVQVRPAAGGPAFQQGKDWQMDPFWGTLGRLDGGAITANTPVHMDYDYTPTRLDTVVVDEAGTVKVVEGAPGVGALLPAPTPAGATAVARIWLPGPAQALSDDNLFPIDQGPAETPAQITGQPTDGPSVAERLLPRTLAKLRNGDPVTIVAWGDSVTDGGGVGGHPEERYQNQFVDMLRQRFPKAQITLKTAGWGGRTSRNWLDSPAGSQYDFQRDVIDVKPDLVTVEFVNDAYLSGDALDREYDEIMGRLKGIEVILITPHLVRPDWMGATSLKFDNDPRPYVISLRAYAEKHNIALADVSRLWCHLWREGIPYVTLLANSINHPDPRGHKLFAEGLMSLFPAK